LRLESRLNDRVRRCGWRTCLLRRTDGRGSDLHYRRCHRFDLAYAKARQPRVGRDVPAVTAVQEHTDESIEDPQDIATRGAAGDRVIQPTYALVNAARMSPALSRSVERAGAEVSKSPLRRFS
jgi:hypothetical protein